MEIQFATTKLRQVMNLEQLRVRTYGEEQSARIGLRLDQMVVADTLAEFILVHPRCHPLKGDRAGTWSAEIVHPYRLIFEPKDGPVPMKSDCGLDVGLVRVVCMMAVDDTH